MAAGCVAHPPLDPRLGRLSSRYGLRPGRTTGRIRQHAGIDLAAERGTPVHAIAPGVVERVASDRPGPGAFSGYGNAVVIAHPDGHRSFYAHLDRVFVEDGADVNAGAVIGAVGNTSNGKFRGMGVHLHLEVRHPRQDGSSPFPGPYARFNIDPEDYLLERGIAFGRRGQIVVNPEACPFVAADELARWAPPEPDATAGLGALGQLGDEYEPPLAPDPDLWLLAKPSRYRTALFAVGGALGLGLVAIGGWGLRRR